MINVEFFPCSGGMAEGFRRAGIRFDFAFDKDPDALDSYEKNLGHRPVGMDVRDLLRMVRGGWSPGPVRLLVADPPCTPWSRAGKRLGVQDERDMLHVTTELIALLRPSAYLIGNVPGLDDSTQWHHVQAALAPLRKAGYCIADYGSFDAADYGVPQHRVRPFWFGHIEGPCISWPLPTHGPPAAGQISFHGTDLHSWVTCRDALEHLPIEELGRPCRLRYRAALATTEEQKKRAGKKARASRVGEPAETIRATADSPLDLRDRHPPSNLDSPSRTLRADGGRSGRREGVLALNERHPACSPTSPAPTIRGGGEGHSAPQVVLNARHPCSEADRPGKVVPSSMPGNGGAVLLAGLRGGFEDDPHPTITAGGRGNVAAVLLNPRHPPAQPTEPARTLGAKDRGQSTVLETGLNWPWGRPSTTITRGDRIPPPGHHSTGSYLSGPNAVVLSERAAAILQGFPDGWLFSGATKKARWSQLGQAMPPALAQAVAESVRQQLERAEREPDQQRRTVSPTGVTLSP